MTALLSTFFLMAFSLLTFAAGLLGFCLWFMVGFPVFCLYFMLVAYALIALCVLLEKRRH